MHETSRYVAQQTAESLTKEQRLQRVNSLIQEAVKSKEMGDVLNKKLHTRGIVSSLDKFHKQNIAALGEKKPNNALTAFKASKSKNRITEFNNILRELQLWGINGYRIIVQLRSTITGQQLIYHVQDSSHSITYILTEQEYLSLLDKSGNASLNYTTWDQIEKAVKKGAPKTDLFKININANKTNLKKIASQENKKYAITNDMKKHALYQYMLQKKIITKNIFFSNNFFL